jgi:NAD(P)-dependent dehydrogenase (short-subunit alcohol dehydrogenase family)
MSTADSSRPLYGKICMVTGATSGIGAVTARELARLGGTVVVVGRNAGRCAREVQRMQRAGGHAEALVADLSSQAQVRRLAEQFASRYGRLDVLVNNAGSLFTHRQVTADGLEMTFAVNHVSAFMLTLLLIEQLGASSSARVVNVSSVAHAGREIDFENLQGEKRYNRIEAYGRSKLANLLFTYELARRLKGTRVTANALHPGIVATNLGADRGWLRARVRNLLERGMLTPEQGARTSIYLATSPEVEGVSGRYFQECREVRSSDASYDEAAAARLWRISEDLTGVRWNAPTARAVASLAHSTAQRP